MLRNMLIIQLIYISLVTTNINGDHENCDVSVNLIHVHRSGASVLPSSGKTPDKVLNKPGPNKIISDLKLGRGAIQRRKLAHQHFNQHVARRQAIPFYYHDGMEKYNESNRGRNRRNTANSAETANYSLIENSAEIENQTEYLNFTDEDYLAEIREFIFPKLWTWLLIIMHMVVFVAGIVGNLMVCTAVYRNRSMRTVTNYFIINLAVGDFLVILFCLPPSVVWDVTSTWFFGTIMCKVVLYIQTVSVTVSVLTLTVISIDRWYAICYPLKFKSTTRRAKSAILLIWILALIFDIPELLVYSAMPSNIHPTNTIYFTQCKPSWSLRADRNWTVLKMILLYFVPLAFMTFAYAQIVKVLWCPQSSSGHHGAVDNRNEQFLIVANASHRGQLRSRKKAAKMLFVVVGMFAFCFFPVHIFCIIRLSVKLTNSDINRAVALLSHWLCYANSAINPIIYNCMSGKFRKEFKRTMNFCSRISRFELYEMSGFFRTRIHSDSTGRSTGTTKTTTE